MGRKLNVTYAAIHGTYWMYYGVIGSFVSLFLLPKGYSSEYIGMIIATGNVLAVLVQPFFADIADRSKRLDVMGMSILLTLLMCTGGLLFFILDEKSLMLTSLYIFQLAIVAALQGLLNTMPFAFESKGEKINFGLDRSFGSLAFAAMSALMGTVIKLYGEASIPVAGIIFLAGLIITTAYMTFCYRKLDTNHIGLRQNFAKIDNEALTVEGSDDCFQKSDELMVCAEIPHMSVGGMMEGSESLTTIEQVTFSDIEHVKLDDEKIGLWLFLQRNKNFFFMSIGTAFVFFNNGILNSFMPQIIFSVNGDSSHVGFALGIMAFLEIPTLCAFHLLHKRFGCRLLLKVAAIGFCIKIGICYLANSVMVIYLAHLFQPVSFALYLPAMVQFIGETMEKGEAVKGQSVFTIMITLGMVFASLIGGKLLDEHGAKSMLLLSTLVTIVGAIIIFFFIDRVKQWNQREKKF